MRMGTPAVTDREGSSMTADPRQSQPDQGEEQEQGTDQGQEQQAPDQGGQKK